MVLRLSCDYAFRYFRRSAEVLREAWAPEFCFCLQVRGNSEIPEALDAMTFKSLNIICDASPKAKADAARMQ